jgi:cysteine desulfurase/selenocysteine lyase
MQFDRRNFIRSASLLTALSLSEIGRLAARQQMSTFGADRSETDEVYWRNLRPLFPLDLGFTYLNNGTVGPSPYEVIDAVKDGMMEVDKHCSYAGWEAASARIARFVGANDDEIALTHNVTDGINIACWGLPLKKGDEVILTDHEHVGNAFPWLNRRKLHGIVIKTFSPAPTADETIHKITKLITPKTKVIAIPHLPCTQGQVMPIKEICKLARTKGIYSIIDGAHGPGMLNLDLHDIGCDTYASCCHKWMLGPKGTGFIYVRKDFQKALQAYFVGAGSDNAKWNMAAPITMGEYADNAHRYYGGTQSVGLYKGVIAAIDFMESIGMNNIHNRIKYLGKYTQDSLLDFGNKIELLTPTEEQSRCAVNGFRIKNVDFEKFYTSCSENHIRIRIVHENNLNSLRVSTHIYNNKEDVDKLMAMIKHVV